MIQNGISTRFQFQIQYIVLIRFIGVQINNRKHLFYPHLASQTVDVMVVTDVQLVKQAFLIHLDCFRNDLTNFLKARLIRQTTQFINRLNPTGTEEIRTDTSNTDHFKVISSWMVFCLHFHHGFKDGGIVASNQTTVGCNHDISCLFYRPTHQHGMGLGIFCFMSMEQVC